MTDPEKKEIVEALKDNRGAFAVHIKAEGAPLHPDDCNCRFTTNEEYRKWYDKQLAAYKEKTIERLDLGDKSVLVADIAKVAAELNQNMEEAWRDAIMDTLINIIKEMNETKFYGELLIKFESGKVIIVKKTESIKI